MDRAKFLEEFADVLQTDENISFETVLSDLSEWDSLAKLTTLAFLDRNFGIKLTFNDIADVKVIEDIAQKAGI